MDDDTKQSIVSAVIFIVIAALQIIGVWQAVGRGTGAVIASIFFPPYAWILAVLWLLGI